MQSQRTIDTDNADIDVGLRAHLLNVYKLVALGLGISAAIALGVSHTDAFNLFYTVHDKDISYTFLGIMTFVATFGSLIVALIGRYAKVSFPAGVMHGLYWLFTSSIGVSLSILFMDSRIDVVHPILATAILFTSLCIYGNTTKRDLSGIGTFCFMGLWGLVIMGFIGIFTGMHLPAIVSGILGVLVFTGLTAYDAQFHG